MHPTVKRFLMRCEKRKAFFFLKATHPSAKFFPLPEHLHQWQQWEWEEDIKQQKWFESDWEILSWRLKHEEEWDQETGRCEKRSSKKGEDRNERDFERCIGGEYRCTVNVHDYPEQQSAGVVCSHQAVDGLKKPPQWVLKLCLLLPLVQPRRKLKSVKQERWRAAESKTAWDKLLENMRAMVDERDNGKYK